MVERRKAPEFFKTNGYNFSKVKVDLRYFIGPQVNVRYR